jgi:hypothetical protein
MEDIITNPVRRQHLWKIASTTLGHVLTSGLVRTDRSIRLETPTWPIPNNKAPNPSQISDSAGIAPAPASLAGRPFSSSQVTPISPSVWPMLPMLPRCAGAMTGVKAARSNETEDEGVMGSGQGPINCV